MFLTYILNIFWYYALFLLCKQTVFILYFFYRHYLRPSHDLIKRYGEKSWALVTGATDGIGKGIALDLAKKGFNIILVSRNIEKLLKVEKEISIETNNKIEIKTVPFDFSEKFTLKDYTDAFEFVSQLDLSILVNNVGWTAFKSFDEHTSKAIQDHVNLNVIPQGILTSMFLKQLSTRSGLKSAIINLSSFSSMVQIKKFITYNAVKTFNNTHSKLIHYELKNSIDSISIKPMWVETPLSQKKENWLNCITVPTLCEAIFKQLGNDIETYGAARHEWQANLIFWVPQIFLSNMRLNNTYH